MPGSKNLLTLLGALAVVAVVLGLAYAFTRFIAGSGPARHRAGGGNSMRVLERLSLGRDQHLAVVMLGKRYFLIGITAAGISLVAELSEEEWLSGQRETKVVDVSAPGLQDAFRNVLRQRFKK